jgi:hypothetical protein
MRLFARLIKHSLNVSVQRPQHADARHHGRAAEFDDQQQGFDCGLRRLVSASETGSAMAVFSPSSYEPATLSQ